MIKAVQSHTLSFHLAQGTRVEAGRTTKHTGLSSTPNFLWQIHLARPWFQGPPRIGEVRRKSLFLLMEGRI